MSKVSVIIPAFQAALTLPAALRSVLNQTHREIEVLVVDDGSSDPTHQVAEEFRAADPRVKVFSQGNAGVAAARNLAIERASGAFIAPIDADDLWHPRKLELQLQRFAQGGERIGLVYNWHRPIDTSDRVRPVSASPRVEGFCLHRHLAYNFVANGSTPLIRREALDGIRYDPALAQAGCGGCEDYLLQLRIAERWEFGLVPAWLTGYRHGGVTMSSDVGRMIRSHLMVLNMMKEDAPASARAVIRRRIARLKVEHVRNRLYRGKPLEAARSLVGAGRHAPLRLARFIAEEAVAAARELRPVRTAGDFSAYDPRQPDGAWRYKLAGMMARLKAHDDLLAAQLAA